MFVFAGGSQLPAHGQRAVGYARLRGNGPAAHRCAPRVPRDRADAHHRSRSALAGGEREAFVDSNQSDPDREVVDECCGCLPLELYARCCPMHAVGRYISHASHCVSRPLPDRCCNGHNKCSMPVMSRLAACSRRTASRGCRTGPDFWTRHTVAMPGKAAQGLRRRQTRSGGPVIGDWSGKPLYGAKARRCVGNSCTCARSSDGDMPIGNVKMHRCAGHGAFPLPPMARLNRRATGGVCAFELSPQHYAVTTEWPRMHVVPGRSVCTRLQTI